MLLCSALLMASASCASIRISGGPGIREDADGIAVKEAIRQARASIAGGDYNKALGIYSRTYNKYPYNVKLMSSYSEAGEQIRNGADSAYKNASFAEAGHLYNLLFKNDITSMDFAPSLSFNSDYLRAQMQACSKTLTEIGLTKYREEKLDEAILMWKQVLTFDPENRGVRKAINTANKQLRIMNSFL